jgi:AmpD protein
MRATPHSAATVHIDAPTGLLQAARQVLSPHCDERPAGARPELIVLHNISLPPAEFGGPWIDRLFSGCPLGDAHPFFATLFGLQVSAHALIRRDGELTQYVPFHQRAWHAGVSRWQGREACNDFSIGIELEGADDVPYTDAQYAALTALVRALQATYPELAAGPVAGHSDIAPGRKTDPGPAFDWARLRAAL